jgi:hypothetical protein
VFIRARAIGTRFALLLGVVFLLSGAAVHAVQKTDEALAIVAHPDVPVDDLPLAELRRIFLGERQLWPDGSRITMFIHMPGTRERAATLSQIYRMREAEYRRYWVRKIFRAEIAAGPKIARDSAVMSELLTRVPGAVAAMPVSEVRPPLKVIRVNGHLPGEAGYPVR